MTALAAAESGDLGIMIKGLFSYELFGQTFWITTTHVALLLIVIVLLIFGVAVRRCMMKALREPDGEIKTPGPFQNVAELIVEMLDNMVQGSMGKNAVRFRNYIGTVFLFIILSNISGIFGLRSPTADYGVTLALGLITFVLIHYNGIKKQKIHHFTNLFQPVPLLFPINIISEVATPLSLSLRLFGNVMSGTIMLGLWYSLMPWFAKIGIPAFLHVYLDLFSGAIQAYVFCMLSMVYVTDKIGEE